MSDKFQSELQSQVKFTMKDFATSISFVEYVAPNFEHFESFTKNQSMSEHYFSAFYVPVIDFKQDLSKLELAVALDLVSGVLAAFSTSQALAAHNLWNLFMGENLRDYLPDLIVSAAFTQMCQLTQQAEASLFYLQVLLSIREQTDGSTLFKPFGKLIEEGLVWLAKHHHASSALASKVIVDGDLTEKARNLIAYYVSQQPDFRGDSIFQRLEDSGVSEAFI